MTAVSPGTRATVSSKICWSVTSSRKALSVALNRRILSKSSLLARRVPLSMARPSDPLVGFRNKAENTIHPRRDYVHVPPCTTKSLDFPPPPILRDIDLTQQDLMHLRSALDNLRDFRIPVISGNGARLFTPRCSPDLNGIRCRLHSGSRDEIFRRKRLLEGIGRMGLLRPTAAITEE